MMVAMTRLATIRTPDGTRAVRVDDAIAVEIGHADVGTLLADPAWRSLVATADGTSHPIDGLDYAPVVTNPEKVICVGLNYRDHIAEMGHAFPEYPTLFPKFARTLIGAYDPIARPPESVNMDWEAELTVVIGAEVRRADADAARAAIAGYTVANDVSMRDYQRQTSQFFAGKVWEATTPVGPWLTVAEPGEPSPVARITSSVDGEVMQDSSTGELLFDPVHLVQYVSTMITLAPGDLILTGTPGGVGAGRQPARFLQPGELLVTAIDGFGELRNPIT